MTDNTQVINAEINTKAQNPDEAFAKLHQDVKSMAEKFEKGMLTSESLKKEMEEKMAKDLTVLEQKNQEVLAKIAEVQKINEAQTKQIRDLENHCATNVGKKDNANGEEIMSKELHGAFIKMITAQNEMHLRQSDTEYAKVLQRPDDYKYYGYGRNLITQKRDVRFPLEQKFLRTDQADMGGLLIAPEISMQILKRGTEYSPIRQYANVMSTYSNNLLMPVRNILADSFWEYEYADVSANVSNSQYNQEQVHMKRLGVQAQITLEMLTDSPFDMPSLITADVTESFAQAEGAAFINGNGVNQPEGILNNSKTTQYTSLNVGQLSSDDLYAMQASIKWEVYGQPQYERTYIMNKATAIKIMQMKDGVGHYMWTQGNLAAGIPNTIAGEAYIVAPDMPLVASGNKAIVMGDLKRGYTIVDRMQMYLIRDELTYPGLIKFTFFRRLGAKVVMPEAFVICNIQ